MSDTIKGACLVIGAGEDTGGDAILSPDAIAANYVILNYQLCSAWTHELDLRP